MAHRNRFVIRNDFSQPLALNIEPEGAFFPLEPGEEVSVSEAFTSAPVTLELSESEQGSAPLTRP
jgi:hypothetical protein